MINDDQAHFYAPKMQVAGFNVYDMMGRMISGERRVENGELVISVPASGVYLVRIGEAPARRIVVMR